MTERPGGPPPTGAGSDADLVARVLSADAEAFAAVFDRYGDRLHDFAYSLLRHRAEAADAVADAFVTLAERLLQLRDPDRLRPWLYAVVRRECLHRLTAHSRSEHDDDRLPFESADRDAMPVHEASRLELQQLVRNAAAELAERDQALLDLHLRHGLDGAELAEAMEVTTANAEVMLARAEARVDRGLSALLVARLGRQDCAELDELLTGWDGSLSSLLHRRVARHVDRCASCGRRRGVLAAPLNLLATVPLVAAPAELRGRVLDGTELVAHAPPPEVAATTSTAPGDGTEAVAVPAGRRIAEVAPPAPETPRSFARRAMAPLVVTAVVVAVAVLFWPKGNQPALPAIVAGPVPTTGGPTAPPTALSGGLPPTPTAQLTVPYTSPPSLPATPTPLLPPGALTLNRTSLDLGRSGTQDGIRLSNSGGSPFNYMVAPEVSWLSAGPAKGTLAHGKSQLVVLRVDRSAMKEGLQTGIVQVLWDGGALAVQVVVDVEHDPVVGVPHVQAAPSCDQPAVPVTVRVTDESDLRTVRLSWTGPGGAGTVKMTPKPPGGIWAASMGPFPKAGKVTYQVTAVDAHGNTATGAAATVRVPSCPTATPTPTPTP